MYKLFLLTSLTLIAPAFAEPPHAEWPHTSEGARRFIDAMPADSWIRVVQQSVSLDYFVGRDAVAVINATPDAITTITCDGKWQLVGNSPYIKEAPKQVGSRNVAFIPTKGFDGYCQKSIVGLTAGGDSYNGQLSIPGNFKESISIVFRPVKETNQ